MTLARTLDRTDREILGLLQKDARATHKEIGAAVGLAPSSVHVRIQRMLREGTIRAFRAEVDPSALGVALQAIVFVRVRRHAKSEVQAFNEYVAGLPEVRHAYYVAGSHDLLVHVLVRDVAHLRELVIDQMSTREEVGQIETALIFEHRKQPLLPDYMPAEG